MRSTIGMAREAGFAVGLGSPALEKFERLIELARADEREAIMEEWWMCVQSDLENGVKSLNEQAAAKWRKEYPEIAKFGAWLNERGETK
jgi:transposase-like protein